MKVDPDRPFQIIYSLYQHEYLEFLFESYAVQLNDRGNLTFTHQNISSKNVGEFASQLDENDYKLVKYMDEMAQEVILKRFSRKRMKPEEFFLRTYDKKVGDELLQREISQYVEKRRTRIMPLLSGKNVFEMGSDGEPAWRRINVIDEKATILFHFRKNEDNTHYFPTIKLKGVKVDFRNTGSYIIANDPAWMMVNQQLFSFEKEISGAKLKPFLNKKFILIPKKMEETYYEKFVASLVASFDVYARGFDITTEHYEPKPVITLSEVQQTTAMSKGLFDNENDPKETRSKVLIELSHTYGGYRFRADHLKDVSVRVEKQNDKYTFRRVRRYPEKEIGHIKDLEARGLLLRNSRVTLPESAAFDWLNTHQPKLLEKGFTIQQAENGGKKYFLGESRIDISIREEIDWFDVKAVVRFGEFEVPFAKVRKLILQQRTEIGLPNGEIGIIPQSWIEDYKDLFMFSEEGENRTTLKKHHVALVQSLSSNDNTSVAMSRKLQKLMDFTSIEDQPLPEGFTGELRGYQKAGYNWMSFLNEFSLGGCLADDMGLGKTIQTLVMLQDQAEKNPGTTSLLVMPTSLIYNWQMEARKFTPKLKVLIYTGTNRKKDPASFANYDLVITSYGISRIDTEVLAGFYFNYIILDESQAIKNPDSIVSKSVRKLNSRRKLILTGTPIENSTLDLWSQLSFVNPGLLGGRSYFKKEYLIPIEKKQDQEKTQRLNAMIKPFMLRRDKSQVASDLPEKTMTVKYCSMSEAQQEVYEAEKNYYRNHILEHIEKDGISNSQIILLQGLTKLRQIANHPALLDENYSGDSGKLEDITYMIENTLKNNHSILIFSQFVKHLALIRRYLDQANLPYAYLDGSTKDRQRQVETFQNNDSVNLFLISLKAGGLGLNLTKADYVFLLDPWWNPAIEAQATDRAHRIGQQSHVFTYKFITKDTIEEKILTLQNSKLKLAQDLIKVEESFVKSLSQSDIEKLFS